MFFPGRLRAKVHSPTLQWARLEEFVLVPELEHLEGNHKEVGDSARRSQTLAWPRIPWGLRWSLKGMPLSEGRDPRRHHLQAQVWFNKTPNMPMLPWGKPQKVQA